MSQSLAQLRAIYIKSYHEKQKPKKSKHVKSLSQVPKEYLEKLNKVKQEIHNSTNFKPARNLPQKLSIKYDDGFLKLENLGAKSTLARNGLLALQQRIIELESADIIRTLRNIEIDDKNWRVGEEGRIDKLYKNYDLSPVIARQAKNVFL
ncbi:unnamed protein product [Blepharisma stoltei]|uniref:Uncharacterized protein n=1 Tax=Blepharisma stoltei TaxID=1481888 RepID=A0AAU9JT44_9CILI|nr:unnamed protein product [Blepharisma stoltei]